MKQSRETSNKMTPRSKRRNNNPAELKFEMPEIAIRRNTDNQYQTMKEQKQVT